MTLSDVTVVIRAAGERTKELCAAIVAEQLGDPTKVHIVCERPFHKALQRSIEIAVAEDAKWSVFLDADVLLRRNALHDMLTELENAPRPFYMMNFLILDRGFCGFSYGGVHCYTTKLLEEAYQFIPMASTEQRPETYLVRQMAKAGYPWVESATIVGLHGYEQFYRDLYRTTFVRAAKFARLRGYMLRRYRAGYAYDDESKVMLWGLIDGILHSERDVYAPLDVGFYAERSSQVLEMLGIAERGPLSAADRPSYVEDVIASFVPDEDYLAHFWKLVPVSSEPRYGGLPKPRHPLRVVLSRVKRLAQSGLAYLGVSAEHRREANRADACLPNDL